VVSQRLVRYATLLYTDSLLAGARSMAKFRKFSARIDNVIEKPGIYDIRVIDGPWLKVGISINLQSRIKDHFASRQSGLVPKPGRNRANPRNVISKKSVLAKHLYYDSRIAPDYDLRTEYGRRTFLANECEFRVQTITDSKALKLLEKKREETGKYRYVGLVRKR